MDGTLVRRDFLVDRNDLARHRWSDPEDIATGAPPSGEIVVDIERFSFTANNITYARTGDRFGYWRYFPAPAPWGLIPVWGIGRVAASGVPEIETGERIYGFWPTSRRAVLRPSGAGRTRFLDTAEHRLALPKTYNEYVRLDHDPDYDESRADEHLVLRPLFSLGFFLAWHLAELGAEIEQVVVSSASSKTALALAFLLERQAPDLEIVGLTRSESVRGVERIGRYDAVLPYEAIETLPDRRSAFVDIAGNAAILSAVHRRFGANLVHSFGVGLTRGEGSPPADLPGVKPEFFFTPTHILLRREQFGPSALGARIAEAWTAFLDDISPRLVIETHGGAGALERVFTQTLTGGTAPDRAAIVTFGTADRED